jgi:hypothetical protein
MKFTSLLPLNSKLNGGGLFTLRRNRFTPQEKALLPLVLYRKLCLLQDRSGRVHKISSSPRFEFPTRSPQAGSYTDFTIPSICSDNYVRRKTMC